MESLSEPSPYDSYIAQQTAAADVVPDLLMFSRPLLDLSNTPVITVGHINTICTDSGSPAKADVGSKKPISSEVLRTMTEAMGNLTTLCNSDQARNSVRDSMSDMTTNDEGNK